jgi:hypothetical protein
MSSSEKRPLYTDVVPSRVSSGEVVQKLELGFFVLISLLAISACVVSVVYTISTHPEHLVAAIAVLFSLLAFFLIARSYKNDEIQDRKIVYLVALTCIFTSITAIVFVAQWQSNSNCTTGPAPSACPAASFYSPSFRSSGTCVTSPATFIQQLPCFFLTPDPPQAPGTPWVGNKYTLNRMNNNNTAFVSKNTFGVKEAYQVFQRCFQSAGVVCNLTGVCPGPRL